MHLPNLLPFAILAMSLSTTYATFNPRTLNSQTTTKPTIVIAPGAWQLPATWDSYVALLKGEGYETVLVPNLSVGGTVRPLAGLSEDTINFQATISKLADKGKEMVLFGHSYGGAVISAATEGFDIATRKKAGKKGGVLLTAFMSAFVLPRGASLFDLLGGQPLPWMVLEDDMVTGNSTLMPEVGFNGLSQPKKDYYMSLTTWSALNAFIQPNTYEPWSNGVPAAYIFTTLDNALPLANQKAMAGFLASTNFTEYTMETGHCGFLVAPKKALAIWEDILEVAADCK